MLKSSSLINLNRKDLERVFVRPLPKYFNVEEINKILDSNVFNIRNYTVVNLLWKTGIRCSELINLKLSDLDPYNKLIRIQTLKTGLKNKRYLGIGRKSNSNKVKKIIERVIPINNDIVNSLLSYSHGKNVNDNIFNFSRVTCFRIVKQACSNAGFTDARCHPHTFRHSFAVHILTQGIPITILKDLLGHSNISNTLIYLRMTQLDTKILMDQIKW